MRKPAWQSDVSQGRSSEGGFALIEVLVSAVVAVVIGGAVFGLLGVAARQASEERQHTKAYAIAQQDQARLRGLRISALNRLNQTRTVALDGTNYTVVSSGAFINDTTGTASCGTTSSSADYVKVSSTVRWPSIGSRPPVVIQSLIAPPNGSLDPTHGTLTVFAQNAQTAGISGVGLSGSGAGTFSGSTDSAGCAQFPDQAAGNYTLTPTASGLVDQDGNAPAPQTVSVAGGSTNTVSLLYDRPGSIPVTFKTRVNSNTTLINSSSDTVTVFNTGMTQAESFGTAGTTRLATITATPLFPFTSPDTVYAGACTANNPNPTGIPNPPGAAAMPSVTVPPGGSAAAVIQLPALNLTVRSGTNSGSPGSLVNNAHVVIYDLNCSVNGSPVRRVLATNSSGVLPDPGLPWSTYAVCADNGARLNYDASEDVKNLVSGTPMILYLLGTGSTTGVCP